MTETKQPEQLKEKETLDKPEENNSEKGGRKGLEPTRYGDWEKNGIISDF